MGLTYRGDLSRPLNTNEIDDNFRHFTGSHAVTGSITATQGFVGNLTGSVSGTISNAVSSSYALTASYALNGGGGAAFPHVGDAEVSGTLYISGSIIPATDGVSATSSFNLGSPTAAWKDIYVSNGTINFLDNAGTIQTAISATSGGLVVSGSLTATDIVPASGSTLSVTGSLQGTASFANNASTATSASYALTASYALNNTSGVDLTSPEVVLVNATGSVPDDSNSNYSLTVPLGFSSAPNKVLAILTTDNFNINTLSNSFSAGTGWGFGVAGPGAAIQNVSEKVDSSIRFVVSSDYTQTFRAQDVGNAYGGSREYGHDGGELPSGSPLRYSESTTLLGVVGYFGSYVGIGYQSGINQIQTHSVMQSAYLDGNNLVILMKKRISTVGEILSRFKLRVYKLS